MGHRPSSVNAATRRRRRAPPLLAAIGLAAALAGCGAAGNHLSVGTSSTTAPTTLPPPTVTTVTAPTTSSPTTSSPTTSSASPSTTAAASGACVPGDLTADQTPLSEGSGQYYLAWSLTNASSTPCTVAGGRPSLALETAGGESVQTYSASALSLAAPASLTVSPGGRIWFLTDETATACPSPQTVTGGPFHYAIALPGDAGQVTWSPSYLQAASVPDLCTHVDVSIGPLQNTEPRP